MTDPSSILPEKYDREIYDLSNLHIHPDIQVRISSDDDALERYTMAYKDFVFGLPPIKVCVSKVTGEFYVVDGHHRFEAAKRAGLTCIEGFDLGEMSLAEMISESISSNCAQGLALTRQDRKRAAELLCKYNPQITARDAAKKVGLSKSLVATILKEYRAKTFVICDECKASVLRLFAEDSTNGWVQVLESKRERWFCCEDHRREFFAKQAEKVAENQTRREDQEERRNSDLDSFSDDDHLSDVSVTLSEINPIPDPHSDSGDLNVPFLRLCPFCKHTPNIHHPNSKFWFIRCDRIGFCKVQPSTCNCLSLESAVKAWNGDSSTPDITFASQLEKFLRFGYKWTEGKYSIHIKLKSHYEDDVLYIHHDDGENAHVGFYALPDILHITIPTLPHENS